MFVGFLLLTGISLSLAHNFSTGAENSSYFEAATQTFAECPDTHSSFCYHGTCRFLVSEWEASCICFKGYIGIRCEHMDLLQVMAADPPPFLVVALTVSFLAIILIGSACLVIYFYRVRRERNRLTLLKNIEPNDV